jgi:hypothetical protein
MTLEGLIETTLIPVLNTATSKVFTFLHGTEAEQNLNDDAELPVFYLGAQLTSEDTLHKSGAISATYDLEIFFGDKSEPDWTQAQHNAVIEEMRDAARRFITVMQNENSIREVVSASRINITNIFDKNLTGCLLRARVILTDGNSICI